MLHHFRLIWQDPTLRLLAALALLFGCFVATIGPYQSLIAISVFGLSDATYAAILMIALVVAVSAAVGVGIITDQRPSRKLMALLASGAIMWGGALVWLGASPTAFVLAHILFIPLSGIVFLQVFAVTRLVTAPLAQVERDAVLAILRALFAVPFVIGLPLWGAAFEYGLSLLVIYPALVLIGAAMFALTLLFWPADAQAPWAEQKSGLGFRASLGEMLAAPVFLRVLLVGAIHSGGAFAGVLIGLCFIGAGRGNGDIGLFFGLFVLVEVIATLYIGTLIRHLSRRTLIAWGTCIYAVFLILLAALSASAWVWILIIPAGVGGGLIYALAIGYLQDLLGRRAGAGASLLALQRISSDGICAGVFAFGTWVSGYGLVGPLGGLAMLLAIAGLVWLDRYKPL